MVKDGGVGVTNKGDCEFTGPRCPDHRGVVYGVRPTRLPNSTPGSGCGAGDMD